MSKFDPEQFMLEPSEDAFYDFKKDELISLAKHLKLEVKKAMRKHQIQDIIVKHLVSLKVFEEAVLETYEAFDSEEKKLQFHLELKKLEMQERLEREEKERQERPEKEEQERQERKEEKEREERLEKEKMELQHELEMKKLELQLKLGSDATCNTEKYSAKFDVTKYIKLVPPFQGRDVDKYFLHFEKVAGNLKWPKEYWVMLLQSVLVGKAREIYTQLSVEQAASYDTVKEVIHKGYELIPEAYRQKFRNCEKLSNQT